MAGYATSSVPEPTLSASETVSVVAGGVHRQRKSAQSQITTASDLTVGHTAVTHTYSSQSKSLQSNRASGDQPEQRHHDTVSTGPAERSLIASRCGSVCSTVSNVSDCNLSSASQKYMAYSSDEEFEQYLLKPKTDYTYSRSISYNAVSPQPVGPPNMSRHGLRKSQAAKTLQSYVTTASSFRRTRSTRQFHRLSSGLDVDSADEQDMPSISEDLWMSNDLDVSGTNLPYPASHDNQRNLHPFGSRLLQLSRNVASYATSLVLFVLYMPYNLLYYLWTGVRKSVYWLLTGSTNSPMVLSLPASAYSDHSSSYRRWVRGLDASGGRPSSAALSEDVCLTDHYNLRPKSRAASVCGGGIRDSANHSRNLYRQRRLSSIDQRCEFVADDHANNHVSPSALQLLSGRISSLSQRIAHPVRQDKPGSAASNRYCWALICTLLTVIAAVVLLSTAQFSVSTPFSGRYSISDHVSTRALEFATVHTVDFANRLLDSVDAVARWLVGTCFWTGAVAVDWIHGLVTWVGQLRWSYSGDDGAASVASGNTRLHHSSDIANTELIEMVFQKLKPRVIRLCNEMCDKSERSPDQTVPHLAPPLTPEAVLAALSLSSSDQLITATQLQQLNSSLQQVWQKQLQFDSSLQSIQGEVNSLRSVYDSVRSVVDDSTQLATRTSNSLQELTDKFQHRLQSLQQQLGQLSVKQSDTAAMMNAALSAVRPAPPLASLPCTLPAGADCSASVSAEVSRQLAIYHADRTALVDYARESAGGWLVCIRSTERFTAGAAELSLFSVFRWFDLSSPRLILKPIVGPGVCFAFTGVGYFVIALSHRIHVTGFAMEHVPASIAVDSQLRSAPKHFTVLALTDRDSETGEEFGSYEFDSSASSLQLFNVSDWQSRQPVDTVELRIHSNWGHPDYTCLYRFRVHGHLPQEP